MTLAEKLQSQGFMRSGAHLAGRGGAAGLDPDMID